MIGKKQIKWILWCFLLFLVVKLYASVTYNVGFIKQSVITAARIVSVDKTPIGYTAKVRFLTSHATPIEAKVFSLAKPLVGKLVSVKYNPVIPVLIEKNSLLEMWLNAFLTASLIVGVIFFLYIIKIFSCWDKNRNKKIKQTGNHIYTKFKAVEAVLKVRKEGKHPYQIISSWHNGKNNKEYFFKSEYLWNNPVEYILDQTIVVLIDNKNVKKYVMDLSFLPENIIK